MLLALAHIGRQSFNAVAEDILTLIKSNVHPIKKEKKVKQLNMDTNEKPQRKTVECKHFSIHTQKRQKL